MNFVTLKGICPLSKYPPPPNPTPVFNGQYQLRLRPTQINREVHALFTFYSSFEGTSYKKLSDTVASFLFLIVLQELLHEDISFFTTF